MKYCVSAAIKPENCEVCKISTKLLNNILCCRMKTSLALEPNLLRKMKKQEEKK
jgi:hypothetical protein